MIDTELTPAQLKVLQRMKYRGEVVELFIRHCEGTGFGCATDSTSAGFTSGVPGRGVAFLWVSSTTILELIKKKAIVLDRSFKERHTKASQKNYTIHTTTRTYRISDSAAVGIEKLKRIMKKVKIEKMERRYII